MPDQPLPEGSRVLLYVRVSPRPEGNDGELSIESQLAELRQAAAAWGWVVVQEYADQLLSGSTEERPAFQALIEHALQGDVDGVLIWSLSRFSRDLNDSPYWKAVLGRAGVRVIPLAEQIPTGDWGAVIERIYEVQASQDLVRLRRDVRRGQRHLIRQGYTCGGRAPRGYRRQPTQRGQTTDGEPRYNSTLVPDPARAADVRGAFEMLINGATYREINARYRLYKNPQALHDMFRNPVYKGWLVYGRYPRQLRGQRVRQADADHWTINQEAHQPIVPPALWDQAQEVLDGRKLPAERARLNTARATFLLSGLAVCGICGANLSGTTMHVKGRVYRYYRCVQRAHRRVTCLLPHIRQERLEDRVLEVIAGQILTPAHIADLVSQINDELARGSVHRAGRRAALEQQLQALDQRIGNLIEAIELHGVQAGDVGRRLRDLTDRREQAQQDLDALVVEEQVAQPLAVTAADVVALVADLTGTLATGPLHERRALLKSFISAIQVWPQRVRIVYRAPSVAPASPEFAGEWEL